MKEMEKKIMVGAILLAFLTGAILTYPGESVPIKNWRDTAVFVDGNRSYVAYVDFQNMTGRLALVNAKTGNTQFVSSEGWDVRYPAFHGRWLTWYEHRDGKERAVWLDIINHTRVTSDIDGRALLSAREAPYMAEIRNGGAEVYAWDGNDFSPSYGCDIIGERYYMDGSDLYCLQNRTIYSWNGSALFTFPREIRSFAVVNGTIFATYESGGKWYLEYVRNGTELVLGEYENSLSHLKAAEGDEHLYVVVESSIDRGKYEDDIVDLYSISRAGGFTKREVYEEGVDYYLPSICVHDDTPSMAYLFYDSGHYILYFEANALSGDRTVLKETEGMGTGIYMLLILPAMFMFIFGMIPFDRKQRQQGKSPSITARFHISYEPYSLLKGISVLSLLVMTLVVINIMSETVPEVSARSYPYILAASYSLLFSALYLVSFAKERNASRTHQMAYAVAILLLVSSLWFLLGWNGDVSLALISVQIFFLLIVSTASLTIIGLCGKRNMWLLMGSLFLFSIPVLLSIPNLHAYDFYPSPSTLFYLTGEPHLILMFLVMLYFFLVGTDILMIPKEQFIPVTRWKKEDYLALLNTTLVTTILATTMIVPILYIFTSMGPLGLLSISDGNTLQIYGGVLFGMAIFISMMGHVFIRQNLKNTEELFIKPTKNITATLWASLLIFTGSVVTAIFGGILSLFFMAFCYYDLWKAYSSLKGAIEQEYGKIDLQKAKEKVEKEENLMEPVPIGREELEKVLRKGAKKDTATVMVISVVLLFLWKMMSMTSEPVYGISASPPINAGFLLLSLVPLLSMPLMRRAVRKKGSIYDILKATSSALTPIVVGIMNVLFIGMLHGNPALVVLSLATSFIATVDAYRIRTVKLFERIDQMDEKDLMVPKAFLIYAVGNRETSVEEFSDSGYSLSGDTVSGDVGGRKEPPLAQETEGPGALLTSEPEDYMRRRAKKMRIAIGAIAGMLPIIGIFISMFNPSRALPLMVVMVAGAAIIYALFRELGASASPIVFYENGVEFQTPMGVRAFMYYSSLEISTGYGTAKKTLILKRRTGRTSTIVLSAEIWPELEGYVDEIRRKAMESPKPPSREGVEIRNPEIYDAVHSRAFLSFFIFGAFLVMGISFSVFSDYGGLWLMMASLFSGYFMARMVSIIRKRGRNMFGREPSIDRRYIVAAILVTFALLFAGYMVPTSIETSYEYEYRQHSPYGLMNLESMEGTDTNLSAPVLIAGNTVLRNLSINMGPGAGIYVADGAHLTMENVSISGERWWFEAYGHVEAWNSSFSDIWGDPSHVNMDGGMEIYGEARFHRCAFSNGTTNLLMVGGGALFIDDCTLQDSGDEGVEVSAGEIHVENTSFENCDWAITSFDSRVYVYNSTFTSCEHGITLSESSAGTIRNTRFEDCGTSIEISSTSEASYSGLELADSPEPEKTTESGLNEVCAVITFPMLLIFSAYAYIRSGRSRKKEKTDENTGIKRI